MKPHEIEKTQQLSTRGGNSDLEQMLNQMKEEGRLEEYVEQQELLADQQKTLSPTRVSKHSPEPSEMASVGSRWQEVISGAFQVDHLGRGFLQKMGAFTWRMVLTSGILAILHMLFRGLTYAENKKFDYLYIFLQLVILLVSFYSGYRGWKGVTQLSYQHQSVCGVIGIGFILSLIASAIFDPRWIEWLFFSSPEFEQFKDEKIS